MKVSAFSTLIEVR